MLVYRKIKCIIIFVYRNIIHLFIIFALTYLISDKNFNLFYNGDYSRKMSDVIEYN